jgi:hypothetical protein
VATALLEVFERLDSDLDGVLCREELNGFLEATEGPAARMPPDVFDWLTATFGGARGRSSGSDSDSEEEIAEGGDNAVQSGDTDNDPIISRHQSRVAKEPRPVGLTPEGFLAAYLYMYASSGGDPTTVWRDLGFLGYDVRPGR